jgi:hypothetical protein
MGVVGTEREHDDLRRELMDRRRDAQEPVVEIRPREARRQAALDADDVYGGARNTLEPLARDLGERVARDPDPEWMCRGEPRERSRVMRVRLHPGRSGRGMRRR